MKLLMSNFIVKPIIICLISLTVGLKLTISAPRSKLSSERISWKSISMVMMNLPSLKYVATNKKVKIGAI